MLAILAFALIIGALMLFRLACAPDAVKPGGADMRTGLVITLAASALLVIFSLTYWRWMGYLTNTG